MGDSARALLEKGDTAFKRGQWRAALQAYAGVVEAVPGMLRARFRIADALLNSGRRDLAIEVYKAIASHSLEAGMPLFGLIAAKMVLLLDPGYEDSLAGAAALYGKDSARLDAEEQPRAPAAVTNERAKPLDLEGAELLQRAAQCAIRGGDGLARPERLPMVPLLSHLDESGFITVLTKMRLRRFADDEVIIREGERGESFFIVADGEVLVKRDIDDEDGGTTLAHLHRGAVFGEMSLISDDPRQASVLARGDVDVLELRRSDLIVAAAQEQSVSQGVRAFTRERFLRHLTATHPFFTSLTRAQRHEVMETFRVVTCPRGEELIREDQQGPGLFLLLGGSATVFKHSGGQRVHLAKLRGGDVCGEMSLVGDQATQATVSADEDLEALFLARDDFKDVVREHPELMRYLAGLTDERLRQNRALLHARGLLEDDEHVMI